MLFRKFTGEIIEISKLNFINDTEYYKAILQSKDKYNIPKQENQVNTIIKLIEQTNKNINKKN